MRIPTYEDALIAQNVGKATPLDTFILNNEPAGEKEETEFRSQLQDLVNHLTSESREKQWQKTAGKLARIANWMYHYVDESRLSKNELDECREKLPYIIEYIAFDEGN